MRENELRKNVRRRRSYELRKGRAVSPVVATLILILIAVAAAAALYLWLVAWQGGVTGNIGTPTPQYTLTIGGSTSVYPFDQVAVTQFEQNNSGVIVSNNQGGTGAGMLAVCTGQVDIGASSSLQTVAGLQTNDGCPATTVITTVAYDAVDVVVPAANTHALQSMSWDTYVAVWDGASSTTATLLAPSIDGDAYAAPINVAPWSTHAALAWDQIPACVQGATNCGGVGNPTETSTGITTIGAGVACAAGTDICAAGGTTSPCGFSVCAGPFAGGTGANLIKTVARSDASGTTQTFEARLLGATSASGFAATTAALAFSGCGSNNLIADCGMTSTLTGNGNPGVIATTAGSPDAIAYASDGLARQSGSGVAFVAFSGVGQGTVTGGSAGQTFAGGIVPTTGATGTISAGIKSSATTPNYAGWRPFELVTKATPTGEAQRFIQFVTDPANNQNFATESAEVSIYSV
ncbi:MAG: substrate-binding domain-containing protein [Thermoplasmata archaeon]|nr:substrate-binding domain-containing protein [Thermoplasmata archaeon]